MPLTETQHHQRYDLDGNLLSEEIVQVDVSARVRRPRAQRRARRLLSDLRTTHDEHDAASFAALPAGDKWAWAWGAIRLLLRAVGTLVLLQLDDQWADDEAVGDLDTEE